MPTPDSKRPQLSGGLWGREFLRWYWLKDELTGFARALGIRSSGRKQLLAQRIAATLDGRAFTEPVEARAKGSRQLCGPLTASTVIPEGQRCSQAVRAWFIRQVGESFRFDAEMRAFFASADGTQTLQDALDRYLSSRGQGPKPIDAQFEYNRFTRAWYATNPNGSRDELLTAWQDYRSRPVEDRGRV